MLRNRNDYPSLITPAGTVAWASIDEPDFEYKDSGEFHVRVRFDGDTDLSAIQDAAQEILDEAYAQKAEELAKEKKGALLKKLHKVEDIIKPELDRESGEPTGFYTIRAGMRHRIEVTKGKYAGKTFEKYPDVFDARGVKLKKRPRIGSGSTVKVSVRIMEYFISKDGEMGIRFELEAVQIIKLVQGGSRDAASYGFAQEAGDAIEESGGFGDESGKDSFSADDADEGDGDF